MQISNHLSKLTVNPTRGGAIDELVLNGRTIIQPMAGLGYESSLLFPFPNRLAEGKFSFQGQSFELPQNDDGRPNALHGLVHDKAFEVSASSESSVTLVYNYDGSLPYFPFPYSLQVTYTLEATSLEMNVTAKNTGNQMMPWGFGWHPYFLVEKVDECALQLPKVNKIHADDMLLPNGKITEENTYNTATQIKETEFDTCFKLSDKQGLNHTHLYYPDGGLLDIWQEDLFPFIQVYTPADRKTIAIEPMTCGVNAFNSGDELKFLDSGNDWSMRFGLTYNGVK